jgi:hypothetical protein
VALGLRAFSTPSDLLDVGDGGLDASPPVAALCPAPGDRVGNGEKVFAGRAPVLVPQRVSAAGGSSELDEVLSVPAE